MIASPSPLEVAASRSLRSHLDSGEVHVWYAWTNRCNDARSLDYFHSLLTAEEERRLERFAFESLRHEYLLTRALCRTCLSRYADVAPEDWSFRVTQYGRPELSLAETAGLKFNLSNARTLVACAVASRCEVGVDVEELDRHSDSMTVARRVFTPMELRDLYEIRSRGERRRRFFELWTLKESYIKARGLGMSLPLDEFSFDLSGSDIAISFDRSFGDCPRAWQFHLYRPSERHVMALALRNRRHAECIVRVRETIPGAAR
jgi:4'-phosphopantetheinyl transferase